MDRWLHQKNVIRVFALLMGVLLWAIVHMDKDPAPTTYTGTLDGTRTIHDVGIEIVGLDEEQYYIQSMDTETISITLSGRKTEINQVSTKDGNSIVQVDLSGLTEGNHVVPLQAVNFPSTLDIDLYPETVTVSIGVIEKREVAVDVEMQGSPAEGFRTGVPILNPSRVFVSAPAEVLDELGVVHAEVNINGAKETISGEYKLVALNKAGTRMDVEISPAVVSVEIPITSPFKTMPLQVRLVGTPPAGYSIESVEQSVTEVTVYGNEQVLQEMEFYEGLEIDVSGLTADKLYSLNIPIKDQIDRVYPETVDVEISIVPSVTKAFADVPIVVSGENEEYTTTIVSPQDRKVDVVVEGAPSVIRTVEAGDIQVILDVSNLPPGTYTRTLDINLPSHVKAKETQVHIQIAQKDAPADPDTPPTEEPQDQETGTEPNPPQTDEETGDDAASDGTETDPETGPQTGNIPEGS
ncbi:YbbR-like domain-containing protein [Marinicrinis lubricantis]|uniref:YbbR-like domain-containing protein n=1 Tax=Marinicrinis lubricantis TaxID=2086470 RepID=A0ABW1INV6_9BACL